jgi:Skp family chaperone for outer membrane proteins
MGLGTNHANRAGLVAACALAVAFGTAVPLPVATSALLAGETAGEEKRKWVDSDGVYYGDAREWEKPAQVDADAVYKEIEEYKTILEEKLEPKDARYGILMSKASRKFLAAVRSAAKAKNYDLVARIGAVHGVDNVPTITRDVIQAL